MNKEERSLKTLTEIKQAQILKKKKIITQHTNPPTILTR